jgi:hypothetical protein
MAWGVTGMSGRRWRLRCIERRSTGCEMHSTSIHGDANHRTWASTQNGLRWTRRLRPIRARMIELSNHGWLLGLHEDDDGIPTDGGT